MRVRVCMYGTCVYVYACRVHASTCMRAQCMRLRVSMYGKCVYVYIQVRYMRLRVCMYGTCVYMCACK